MLRKIGNTCDDMHYATEDSVSRSVPRLYLRMKHPLFCLQIIWTSVTIIGVIRSAGRPITFVCRVVARNWHVIVSDGSVRAVFVKTFESEAVWFLYGGTAIAGG
jgi:hypothetical protein